MSQMNLTTLKKNLEQKNKQELVQEIAGLYNTFPAVKEYYQAQADINFILDKYKEIIKKEFSTTTINSKARLSVAKKAIQNFKKFTKDPELLADIKLTFVESVIDFASKFGIDDNSFHTSPENLFEKTLALLKNHQMLPLFKNRSRCIVDKAADGWRHCRLEEIYENFYGEPCGL
jgi:hypothetical protein